MDMALKTLLCLGVVCVAQCSITKKELELEEVQFQSKTLSHLLAKCPGYPDGLVGRRSNDLDLNIKIAVNVLNTMKSDFQRCHGSFSYSKNSDSVKRVVLYYMNKQISALEDEIFKCQTDGGTPDKREVSLSSDDVLGSGLVDVDSMLAERTITFLHKKVITLGCSVTSHTTATTTETVCNYKSANFTTLKVTGRFGPTTIGKYYDGQDHENLVTLIAGIQYFNVPCTGVYKLTAAGAASGYSILEKKEYRGRGAVVSGTFHFYKGTTLKILVGQVGSYDDVNPYGGIGGGGGTFVVNTNHAPVIIAGGGGGSSRSDLRKSRVPLCDGTTNEHGNPNYDGRGGSSFPGGVNGHGATQSSSFGYPGGGGGGLLSDGSDIRPLSGSGGRAFVHGGLGGKGNRRKNKSDGGFGGGGGEYAGYDGGGGGGGYSGGAGGDDANGSCGGGGGSYNAGFRQTGQNGANDREGYVIVEKLDESV